MCYGVRIIYVLAHSRTLTFAHVHMHSYMHIRDFSCKCSNTRDNKVDCLLRCTHLVRGNATVIAWVKRLDRQPLLLPVYLNVRQVSWMFHRLPFLAAGAIMHLPKPFQSCSRSSFFQSTFQEMFLVNHVVRWQRRLNYFDNGPFYIYHREDVKQKLSILWNNFMLNVMARTRELNTFTKIIMIKTSYLGWG